MSDLAVTNTFVAHTTAVASQVNSNFSDIVNYINNRDDGTSTWDNMNVTATVANPVTIKSNQSSTEVAVDNTATDGDPILTFKLSGSQTHVIGVDDSDSDFLKFATSGITSNVAMQIPTGGSQIQFAVGSTGTPSISWIGDATTGVFRGGAGRVDISNANVNNYTFSGTSFSCAQPLLAADGSAAAPSLSFTNAATSGMFKAASYIAISSGGTERFRFDNNGNVFVTAGVLATTATNGYFAISTCAGAPTGVPSIAGGGGAILQYDSTNHKLYVYDAAWKSVALT